MRGRASTKNNEMSRRRLSRELWKGSPLLTHADAIGCTLERRESSTCGLSLISPLLCQGNHKKSEERIIVVQYAPRTLIDHVICASENEKIRESRES